MPATTDYTATVGRVLEVTPNGHRIEYDDDKHLYWVDGEQVPSVTTILKILDKPALVWWGMKVGAEETAALVRYVVRNQSRYEGDWLNYLSPIVNDPVEELKKAKRTVNHKRDEGGRKGNVVHEVLEAIVADERDIDPDDYRPEDQGYVKAVLAWRDDAKPEIQDCEVMVGVPGEFAGRYDLRARLTEPRSLVVRADTGQRETFDAGSYRWDGKSSKVVDPAYMLQLDGYETGAKAMGYPTTDGQIILRVTADGAYECVRSTARPGSFMAIVEAAKALKDAKPSYPRKPRARKAA